MSRSLAAIALPLSITLIILVTTIYPVSIIVAGLIKLLIPIPAVWYSISVFCNFMIYYWCEGLALLLHLDPWLEWNVEGLGSLNKKNWYLLIGNHHSRTDIMVLCMLFCKHIPMNKYLLKQQLTWVPFIGLVCWALDVPFMRRYSRSYLIRRLERRGKDVETTRRSREKFRARPTTIVDFTEGSRFTEAKKHETRSPYDNLLSPKAAGIAMALNVSSSQFDKLLNVTLCYPENNTRSFYDVLNDRLTRIVVHISLVPIGGELHDDYVNDRNFKRGFRHWLSGLQEEKDCQLTNVIRDKERQSLPEQLR